MMRKIDTKREVLENMLIILLKNPKLMKQVHPSSIKLERNLMSKNT